MGVTTIEWTDRTWNPNRGCSRVSAGCANCYAEGISARFSAEGDAYHGFARRGAGGLPLWTGEVGLIEEHLKDPIAFTKPQRIFVNSMSDTFHERLTNEQIARVFMTMADAQQHTFQVLTKRARRARAWFEWAEQKDPRRSAPYVWPLGNVWLGVSVEDQRAARERIPELRATPAATRFLSVEPLLEQVDLCRELGMWTLRGHDHPTQPPTSPPIQWVIVGGESGPHARPCEVDWIRQVVQQCRVAGVACFVKQLGTAWAKKHGKRGCHGKKHWKGACVEEWPEDLRVREFPREIARAA